MTHIEFVGTFVGSDEYGAAVACFLDNKFYRHCRIGKVVLKANR